MSFRLAPESSEILNLERVLSDNRGGDRDAGKLRVQRDILVPTGVAGQMNRIPTMSQCCFRTQ